MGVADAVLADALTDLLRQTLGEPGLEILVRIDSRRHPFLLRQLDRGPVGLIAHPLRNDDGELASLVRVVPQPQHDERITEPGEPETDATLAPGLVLLLRQRPVRDVENVVEHTDRHRHEPAKRVAVERGLGRKRRAHELRQVDAAQAAATVVRQRLFGTMLLLSPS